MMPPVPALSSQFQAAKGRALVAAQARMVAVAKERHGQIMQREPRPVGFVRYIDGRINVREEAVKAGGLIVYRYLRNQIGLAQDIRITRARLDDVARFALATLRDLSPVASGLYRDSHKLFVNGYPVDNLARWNDGDEISITNYVEYSRILEVGDGRHRVPHLVYDRAADIVAERHGKDVAIEFTWRGITAGYQIAQSPSRRRGFGVQLAARSRAHNKSPVRFPTIVITPIVQSHGALRRIGTAAVLLGASDALIERAMAAPMIGNG